MKSSLSSLLERAPASALLLLAAFAALTVFAPVTGAQDDDPLDEAAEQGFVGRADVLVVGVDVTVFDADGVPVTGLERDDFEIFEDGRPVAITNFYEVRGGGRVEEVEDDLTEEQRVETTRLSLQPIEQRADPLHLVVYIDSFNLTPRNRFRTLHHLRDFLRTQLREGDRVALYTYDRPLKQRVPFTENVTQIVEAFEEVEETTGYRSSLEDDRRVLLEQIGKQPPPRNIDSKIKIYARGIQNDLSFSLEGLKNLIDSVSGLPGRKAVLYVSDGLPMIGAEDIYSLQSENTGNPGYLMEAMNFDFTRSYIEMTQKASAQDVVLFTIDATGLRGYDLGGAQTGGGAGSTIRADFAHRRNLTSSLEMLAEETGGVAVVGTNNLGPAMRRIGDALDHYYSLGYTPAHGRDGRYHDIEVRVKDRKKLKLNYRRGYRFRDQVAEWRDQTTAALLHGAENDSHGAWIEFGEARPKDGEFLVPVRLRVPGDRLTLVPLGDTVRANLTVLVTAADDDGRIAPVQTLPWRIEFPADRLDDAQGIAFTYEVQMLMRGGRQKVAVGLAEDLTGLTSFVTQSRTVGPAG